MSRVQEVGLGFEDTLFDPSEEDGPIIDVLVNGEVLDAERYERYLADVAARGPRIHNRGE